MTGRGEVFGEVVFNTSMSGYQEIITDPASKGQLLTLTYPLIGNYGVNNEDVESASPQVEAVLVREYCRKPSNWRATGSLVQYLQDHGVLGVEGLDTRSLVLHLREKGTMRGAVSTETLEVEELLRRVRAFPSIEERELVPAVTCQEKYVWTGEQDLKAPFSTAPAGAAGNRLHVVVYDLGVRYSILRQLSRRGCRITVVPAGTSAAEIRELKPDGILISDGPGNPALLSGAAAEIGTLLGRYPFFGIGLGHLVLALSLGLETYKLPLGHRGGNHPVRELASGQVQITTQNHGFCARLEAARNGTSPTHVNLNDGTLEGLENQEMRLFSVQFHPQEMPGRPDLLSPYDRFIQMMAAGK